MMVSLHSLNQLQNIILIHDVSTGALSSLYLGSGASNVKILNIFSEFFQGVFLLYIVYIIKDHTKILILSW